jgi:hypothetical protein
MINAKASPLLPFALMEDALWEMVRMVVSYHVLSKHSQSHCWKVWLHCWKVWLHCLKPRPKKTWKQKMSASPSLKHQWQQPVSPHQQ